MTDQPLPNQIVLQIHNPCPKTWAELSGDDSKRFCSDCSLHVLNAARLSRSEAQTLVARNRSSSRRRVLHGPSSPASRAGP
jgi:hypothetical protein